jgi:hypothetical protein
MGEYEIIISYWEKILQVLKSYGWQVMPKFNQSTQSRVESPVVSANWKQIFPVIKES